MDMVSIAQAEIAKQSFSNKLGARVTDCGEGRIEMRLTVDDTLLQQNGFVHGGVLAYLADNALTFAGGTVLLTVLTSEIKINYLRPAVGEELIARANVLSAGRTQAVTRCEIYTRTGDEEKLVAAAQGTIMKYVADK